MKVCTTDHDHVSLTKLSRNVIPFLVEDIPAPKTPPDVRPEVRQYLEEDES